MGCPSAREVRLKLPRLRPMGALSLEIIGKLDTEICKK